MSRPFFTSLIAATALFAVSSNTHAGLEALRVDAEKLTLARPAPGHAPGDVIGLELDEPAYRKLEKLGSALIEDFPLPGRGAVDLQLTAFDPAPRTRFVWWTGGERVVPPHP